MKQNIRILKKIFASCFVIVMLIWVIFYANFHFSQVYDYFFKVKIEHLFVCVFVFYIHILIVCYAWFYMLRGLGLDVPFWQAAVVLGASNIAKYLPGGIWQIGSRTVGLTNYKREPIKIGLSIFIEQIISLSASFVLFIIFLNKNNKLFWPYFLEDIPYSVLVGSTIVIIFCCCSPYTYHILLRYIPKLNSKFHLSNLKYIYLIKVNFLHYLSLIVFSLGYWICIKFYTHSFSMGFFDFTALIMLATFSGFIAIFTPAGLGVREAILFTGIQPEVGQDMALALAIMPRLLIIISELLFFLFMLIASWFYMKKNQNSI